MAREVYRGPVTPPKAVTPPAAPHAVTAAAAEPIAVTRDYLVSERFSWTRNGVLVTLDAGRIYSRKTENDLITEAIRLGAKLVPIDMAKIHRCPYCTRVSTLK